jgi:putative ABC transport system permease protein
MRSPTVVRACLGLIRVVSRLVPAARREAWRQEWEGEVQHRWAHLTRRGAVPSADRVDLVRRSLGALPDAAWILRQFTLDSELAHDARHGVRLMRRSPGTAATVVVVLGIALGAATVLFGVVDALVLRPLPAADADRVVTIWQTHLREKLDKDDVSPANFLDWRERSRSFSSLAAAIPYNYDWLDGAEPEAWPAVQVTEGFFETAGVHPVLGRTFRDQEHRKGAANVVILTHSLWMKRFGGDPNVVGRSVRFDDGPFTVVGILPRGFELSLLYRDGGRWLYTPHIVADHERRTRGSAWWNVVGRLAPGVSRASAQAEMDAISAGLARENPRTNEGVRASLVPLRDHLLSGIGPALAALGAGIVVLLAIAWSNVAGLLLARLAVRRGEFAVRASLGAGRGRLVGQVLVETAILVGLSSLAGLALALAARGAIVRRAASVPRLDLMTIDARAMGFLIGLAALTTLACAALPALRLARDRLSVRTAEGRVLGGGQERARRALVVSQLALALTLLAASGLLFRSVAGLLSVDSGFRRDRLLSLQIFAWDRNTSAEKRLRFFEDVERRVRAVPGVTSVGAVTLMPFLPSAINYRTGVAVEGATQGEAGSEPGAYLTIATSSYFDTMRIPLRRGRIFDDRDRGAGATVAVINEALERRLFRGADPLGRTLSVRYEGKPVRLEIVGVVGSVRQSDLERPAVPEVYVVHSQVPSGSMTLVVRTQADPAALVRDVQRAIWSVDPLQAFSRVDVVDDLVRRTVADRRLLMTVAGGFAAAALLLAGVGAYGLLSYLVVSRTAEIGVRVALGARSRQILSLILRDGAVLLAAGIGVGLVGAIVAGRGLRAFLYQIQPHDVATLCGVSTAVVLVGFLAFVLPARRAALLDPVRALRGD